MKPRKILRANEARARIARGRTAFEDNYRFHSADDPYVPDTTIPRLRPIPLRPRNVGYLEHEVDDLIDALAKLRDIAPAAHEPLAQRCARARAARRDSVHSKRDKAAQP